MTGFLSVVVLKKLNLNSDLEAVAGLHSCNMPYSNANEHSERERKKAGSTTVSENKSYQ
jgi:hypothetical protein